MINPKIIRVITEYPRRDPTDGGPSGDYTCVEVWVDLDLAARFGDEYHDKGKAKADAFVAGVKYAIEFSTNVKAPETWYVDRWPCE